MSESTPEPTSTELPPELVEEPRLGGTPAGRAANAALLALSRTARSFLLYDPQNSAIRTFIDDLQRKMKEALEVIGPLRLEIRPFEMVLSGEVVYLERDRERSLAFRLFRDGVRRLTIDPAVPWEELLRLLEIVSIRYTGVRQNEDDVVTLLSKAGFHHIAIDAVEGFVPEEEDEESAGDSGEHGHGHGDAAGPRVDAPSDWDLPLRPLEGTAAVAYRDVGAEDRARICAEEDSVALAGNAVRVVAQMLRAVADPTDPTAFTDISSFVGEVRDFLLAEGQLPHLVDLVRALKEASTSAEAAGLVETFTDKRALQRILHSVPPGEGAVPPELLALLDELPAVRLGDLIDILAEERGDSSRRRTRALIERYAPRQPEELFARLRTAEAAVVVDLLRVCLNALPDRALHAALDMAGHADDGVALECLRMLDTAPPSPAVAITLVKMLESSSSEVRLRVAEALSRRKEHSAFGPLVRYVERRAHHSLTTREAETYGQGLARLSPTAALSLFKAWLHQKSLLERLLPKPHEKVLRWAAVAGLGELPGDEPVALLHAIADKGDEELQQHCRAMLSRRQRESSRG